MALLTVFALALLLAGFLLLVEDQAAEVQRRVSRLAKNVFKR